MPDERIRQWIVIRRDGESFTVWAESKEGAAQEFCAKGNRRTDIWRIIAGPLGYLRDNVAG